MKEIMSEATLKNWNRLNKTNKEKLTKRANKRLSKKKIILVEYINNKN